MLETFQCFCWSTKLSTIRWFFEQCQKHWSRKILSAMCGCLPQVTMPRSTERSAFIRSCGRPKALRELTSEVDHAIAKSSLLRQNDSDNWRHLLAFGFLSPVEPVGKVSFLGVDALRLMYIILILPTVNTLTDMPWYTATTKVRVACWQRAEHRLRIFFLWCALTLCSVVREDTVVWTMALSYPVLLDDDVALNKEENRKDFNSQKRTNIPVE